MRIIHFITDEKFLNAAINLFNSIEEFDNRYIVISNTNCPFEFLNPEQIEQVSTDKVPEIISNPSIADVIVLHNLYSLPCRFIKAIDKNIKVAWFSWGFDIYDNKYPHEKLVKIDNCIKARTRSPKYMLRMAKEGVKPSLRKLLGRRKAERKNFFDAIKRVDYFSGVFPLEYDLVRKNPFFHAKQIFFNYPSSIGMKCEGNLLTDLHPKGNSIQVGNSASILGNHRDTLWKIRHLDLHDRKIIAPLSYCGDPLYVSTVQKMGKRLFGEQFQPITEYLPREKYGILLESVSVAIYNIERQAAEGNILINLWNGAKVFLPENSLNYRHFKSLGFHVFSMEKDLTQEGIDTPLTEETIIINRNLINCHYSFKTIQEKTRNSFKEIENDIKGNNLFKSIL